MLVVDGSLDRLCLVCATTETLYAAEAPYCAPAARLRTFVLPGSGHALNVAPNTVDYQHAVRDWIASVIG
ncbi:hypothetical protein [Nocardia arthritidis]|uniref:Alpha/beta hydrolase n=1 Tax=Nocardia arthritidis TaxID=228602 RepID=A0A6G9YM55_9NOCA|nr:hypothetical protein [Nocardia arthritidis]QIS14385.1 hypothetical protein F5544_32740 [Nocardia arthritidis]